MKVVGKITQVLRERYSTSEESYKAFSCGFAAGQAEKVFLGACKAAMFRPSAENFGWYFQEVKIIAEAFGLSVTLLNSHSSETPYEIWIHKDVIGEWLNHEVNSPMWHKSRAEVCGIPAEKVDVDYHLRNGYGQKCENKSG